MKIEQCKCPTNHRQEGENINPSLICKRRKHARNNDKKSNKAMCMLAGKWQCRKRCTRSGKTRRNSRNITPQHHKMDDQDTSHDNHSDFHAQIIFLRKSKNTKGHSDIANQLNNGKRMLRRQIKEHKTQNLS